MGETYSEIPEYLIEWIKKQHVFWVASAPLSADGHVNISPKGVAGTFHVESSTKVWYEDLSGSGAETIAHIRENGRITVLFNAFEGPPRILRLYGKGSFYEMSTPEYEALLPVGTRQPGSRAVVVVDVDKCGTTCGYSVPYYTFVGHRTPLLDWAARKEAIDLASSASSLPPPSAISTSAAPGNAPSRSQGGGHPSGPSPANIAAEPHPNGLLSWWRDRNAYSLDGLPALDVAFKQSPASLGRHQTVRRARQSALNAYPSSKQPVDKDGATASDIRSRSPWGLILWLICWVRWFIPFRFLSSMITSFTPFVGSLLAKPTSAKPSTTRTIRIHGEEIQETSDGATEVIRPPVSWGVKDIRKIHPIDNSAAAGVSPHGLANSTHDSSHQDGPGSILRQLSSTALLGHGISFLLGMMFVMCYREAHTFASAAAHAAASQSR